MDNTNTFDALQTFIDRAEKMGKYPANSAGALKSTIKIASSLISDEEPRTLEYLRDHADEIFARSSAHSGPSIQSYIGRMKRLIEDYQTYGSPPSAMLNWKTTPRIISRKPRAANKPEPEGEDEEAPRSAGTSNTNVLSLALRENVKVRLDLPPDLTAEEAERICTLIKSLAGFGKK